MARPSNGRSIASIQRCRRLVVVSAIVDPGPDGSPGRSTPRRIWSSPLRKATGHRHGPLRRDTRGERPSPAGSPRTIASRSAPTGPGPTSPSSWRRSAGTSGGGRGVLRSSSWSSRLIATAAWAPSAAATITNWTSSSASPARKRPGTSVRCLAFVGTAPFFPGRAAEHRGKLGVLGLPGVEEEGIASQRGAGLEHDPSEDLARAFEPHDALGPQGDAVVFELPACPRARASPRRCRP